MQQETPVSDIVDKIDETVTDDNVRAGELLGAFGHSALLPTLIVPALLVTSPLSAIPFFSSLCGIAIVLIALQGVFGRGQPWLPEFICRRPIPAEKTHRATKTMARLAGWLDKVTRQRLQFLVVGPARPVVYFICALAASMIPLLELVPMSSSMIGAGVSLLAIGMLARDGVFAVVGFLFVCVAMAVPWFIFAQGSALLT
ncbi:exopolysaccharide biosynthesis protein [Yoonia maritima]|uniref:exopolysaccharide biosynthesis protein n=1 Tax=Yoonia maritima TaxID=1435347 RepID=UPI000D105AF1|nr:exopolysaccharide biosynthesis protein [Yoonia maritima]